MADYRHSSWDEFQWEEEIRRDERRISRYYRELASCLDLPGEDELIMGQLAGETDLVPKGCSADALRGRIFRDEDDEDEGEEYDAPRRTSEIVLQTDQLASRWNVQLIRDLDPRGFLAGLGISCAYAKLLARIIDFTDADEVQEKGLKISLLKRSLADLNELLGMFGRLEHFQPALRALAQEHRSGLARIRERLLDRMVRLRLAK